MSELLPAVREMMAAFNQTPPDAPCIPDAAIVRLRALLTVEECAEFAEASGYTYAGQLIRNALDMIKLYAPERAPDLVAIADACGDIDVVNTGAFLAYGIDPGPVHDEIMRSNLEKVGGQIDPVTGKQGKPEGWTAPRLGAVLDKQIAQGKRRSEFAAMSDDAHRTMVECGGRSL